MSNVETAPEALGTAKLRTRPPVVVAPYFELSRLMVVAVQGSNGQLVYKAQTKPNGPWQANWTPVENVHSFGSMTAGITGDGRVAVVAQPASAPGVFYIDEKSTVGAEGWNPPVDLGKPAGVNSFTQFAMSTDADGRVEVFGIEQPSVAGGGRIWWKYQNPNRIIQKTIQVTPPGTQTPITVTVNETAPPLTPWSDWYQLPGGLVFLTAKQNADGRIILFGFNNARELYRNEQKVARALSPADWTGFQDMGSSGTCNYITATRDKLGAMNLFMLNSNDQILHTRQSPPNSSTWTSWSTPGFIVQGVQALAAGMDGDDHIVLATTDKAGIHYVNQQGSAEKQQWNGWIPFSATSYRPLLALDYNADGRLTLFSHWLLPNAPPYGGLWCASQMKLESTEWELDWTQLAPGDIRQYVVVHDLTPPT